jgi:hypothetical protein
VPYFNQCGVDGLIVKKRPGTMAIIDDQQAPQLAQLIDQPQQAQRSFGPAKAFHGYISDQYQIQGSYETVVRHKRKTTHWHNWQPMYWPPYWPELNPLERIWFTIQHAGSITMFAKLKKKLLERLDQAILEVIDKPEKTQLTTAIGTLF